MDEEHGRRVEIEGEFRREVGVILVAALGIGLLQAVRQGVGGIDADAPLDLAGDLVQLVERMVGHVSGRGDAHQRQVSAGAAAHDTDAVGIQAIGGRLAADDADGTLEVLPGRRVLGQAFRARRTVLERDDGHALLVEIPAGRGDLEAVGGIAGVTAAGIDDLDGIGLAFLWEVPFDIRHALVLPEIGRPAFGPDRLFLVVASCGIIGVAVHDRFFRSERGDVAHLAHEFDGPFQTECAVSLVRVEVQFGGDAHPAQLAVNQGGTVGGVHVLAAVVQAHRAGLLVEFEYGAEAHVRAVAVTGGLGAALSVVGDVCGGVDDGPVDVAGDLIQRIDLLVGGRE